MAEHIIPRLPACLTRFEQPIKAWVRREQKSGGKLRLLRRPFSPRCTVSPYSQSDIVHGSNPRKFGPNDVNIKIACCGSDVHTIDGGWAKSPFPFARDMTYAIGHRVKVGDKAT